MGQKPQHTIPEYDLFVSYSPADREWVEGYLLDALDAANVRVLSELNFALGAPRIAEFERAIKNSKPTLLVLSPAYMVEVALQFVDVMVQNYGLESGTWPVIPLLLKPVELPPRLAFLVPLDVTDPQNWDDAIARLMPYACRRGRLVRHQSRSAPIPACAPSASRRRPTSMAVGQRSRSWLRKSDSCRIRQGASAQIQYGKC